MTGDLKGRIALVTGGSRGVGAGIVAELAARGADVAFTYRRRAEEAAAVVKAAGPGEVFAVQGSIDDPERMLVVVEEVVDRFGPIDILVSNAGTASSGHSIGDSSIEEFQRLMNVHTWGPLQLVRTLLPGMRRSPRSDVIVISSVTTDQAPSLSAPYTMAKVAIEMAVRTLAREERQHGLRANVIAPGLVATDMGGRLVAATRDGLRIDDLEAQAPFGRVCRPADVAAMVAHLVGPGAGYVTGQRIVIDGGGPPIGVL